MKLPPSRSRPSISATASRIPAMFPRLVQGTGIFYTCGEAIWSPVHFDESNGRVTGEAVVLVGNVGSFSASVTTLAYGRSSESQTNRLTWVDRLGKVLNTVGEPDKFGAFSLSPNEEWAAALILNGAGLPDLWRVDLRNGLKQKLTTNQILTGPPAWSSASEEIIYPVAGPSGITIYRRSAFASGEAKAVIELPELGIVSSWSADGRYLLAMVLNEKTGQDIELISLEGSEAKAVPLLRMQYNESFAYFSPDGRWIAYVSDESGRPEVYVRSFAPGTADAAPSLGPPWLVSKGGVTPDVFPDWKNDSRTVGYINAEREMMEATMIDSSQGRFGEPKRIRPYDTRAGASAVTSDFQKMLVAMRESPEPPANAPQKLVVIQNWQSLLNK